MPINIFWEYSKAASIFEAQDMLIQMKVADYPNMKKEDRSKLHRSMHQVAYPEIHEANKKEITPEDLMRALNG